MASRVIAPCWPCLFVGWFDAYQKMQKSGETVEFVYNENGLRVQKTAASTGVTKYTLHGKNIVHMTQGSNELHFFYGAQNKPAVVVFNGIPYSYVKNLQGDIVAILDSSKNVVVSYVYDAWGRPISKTGSMAATLGTVQPFRYRGYVYDEEIGLYYLRSRYYSIQHGRLLNVDAAIVHHIAILSNNGYVIENARREIAVRNLPKFADELVIISHLLGVGVIPIDFLK